MISKWGTPYLSRHSIAAVHSESFFSLFYRRKAEIPTYSFEKHQRMQETTTIYSCHVLILEGIFALYDPRVLALLDMKVLPSIHAVHCYTP